MDSTPDNLEIEVKFHLDQPECMHQRLADIGAAAHPNIFETNLRFEDGDGSLGASHQLLRLRQDRTCRLTYKCRPSQNHTECKVYHELEVSVDNFDVMQAILNALGYHGIQKYEKWRQTFHWQAVELCLDTMPYGTFLEIEGPETQIKAVARRLGLQWGRRILDNYLAMFETLRSHHNLPFHDLTFDNFKQHPVNIAPLVTLFEAETRSAQ